MGFKDCNEKKEGECVQEGYKNCQDKEFELLCKKDGYSSCNNKNEEEEYKNSTEEKQADHFALDKLIKDEDWNKFKKNLNFNNNDTAMIAFAKQVKIHPSIVRGRVCFALNNFRSYTSISNDIN